MEIKDMPHPSLIDWKNLLGKYIIDNDYNIHIIISVRIELYALNEFCFYFTNRSNTFLDSSKFINQFSNTCEEAQNG